MSTIVDYLRNGEVIFSYVTVHEMMCVEVLMNEDDSCLMPDMICSECPMNANCPF
jgi:hypothetical protein